MKSKVRFISVAVLAGLTFGLRGYALDASSVAPIMIGQLPNGTAIQFKLEVATRPKGLPVFDWIAPRMYALNSSTPDQMAALAKYINNSDIDPRFIQGYDMLRSIMTTDGSQISAAIQKKLMATLGQSGLENVSKIEILVTISDDPAGGIGKCNQQWMDIAVRGSTSADRIYGKSVVNLCSGSVFDLRYGDVYLEEFLSNPEVKIFQAINGIEKLPSP